jgi:hypothetical protein
MSSVTLRIAIGLDTGVWACKADSAGATSVVTPEPVIMPTATAPAFVRRKSLRVTVNEQGVGAGGVSTVSGRGDCLPSVMRVSRVPEL